MPAISSVREYLASRQVFTASTSQSAIAQVRMLKAAGKEARCVLGPEPYVICWEPTEWEPGK